MDKILQFDKWLSIACRHRSLFICNSPLAATLAWTLTHHWSLHIWTHLGTRLLPRGSKGHKVLLLGIWNDNFTMAAGVPFTLGWSVTLLRMCWLARVTSLHDAFAEGRRRSPLEMVRLEKGFLQAGAHSLTNRKETGFQLLFGSFSWGPKCTTTYGSSEKGGPCHWRSGRVTMG